MSDRKHTKPIEEKWLRGLEFVTKNPNSKRLPNGLNFGKFRRGEISLVVFCESFKDFFRDCSYGDFGLDEPFYRKFDGIFEEYAKHEAKGGAK
jgi:hypothetical protein